MTGAIIIATVSLLMLLFLGRLAWLSMSKFWMHKGSAEMEVDLKRGRLKVKKGK